MASLNVDKLTGEAASVATNPNVVDTSSSANPMVVGITEAMVAAHPELANVRALYVAGNYAAALVELQNTEFYKNTSDTRLANEETKRNKPGVYEEVIKNDWLPALQSYVTQAGITVSDADLEKIARTAYDKGLAVNSPATLAMFKPTVDAQGNAVPNPIITGITGGNASTTRSNLSSLNADYGTGFGQDWLDTAAKSIATGATTEQFWTDKIKSQAAGSNPAWADQINAGMTLKQIASPYINAYSNILGIDPASITMNDTLLKQGLQGTDPTKPAAMPLWQFEKQVRQDPRWATSKDAMDSLSATGSTILKQWGLMS